MPVSGYRGLRLLGGCLISVFLLVSFTVAFLSVYNSSSQRNFESHHERLTEIGESLKLESFYPRASTDQKNFAEVDIIQEILDGGREDLRASAIEGYSSERNRKSISYLSVRNLESWFPNSNEPTNDLSAHFERLEDEFLEIHEALKISPTSLGIDYSKGINSNFDEISELLRLAEILRLRANWFVELGNGQGVAQEVCSLLRLAGHLENEPILLAHLVRTTSVSLALSELRHGLSEDVFVEADLKTIQTQLGKLELEKALLQALRFERAMIVSMLVGFAHDPGNPEYKADPGATRTKLEHFPILSRGLYYDNARLFSEIFQEQLFTSEEGGAVEKLPSKQNTLTSKIQTVRDSPIAFRFSIALSALEPYSGVIEKSLRGKVEEDHALIAIALALFKDREAEYPYSLSELNPYFQRKPPQGIYGEGEYKYRLLENGDYVLYSNGSNQSDEGGLLKKNLDQGDWVWRLTPPQDFDFDKYEE